MSVEQYQRIVNSLDKEIADLEKKKSQADVKAVNAKASAARVSISKTASDAMVKSKMNQIARYEETSRRAEKESAGLQKRIADKREKRNDAYLRLQKEQENEQKKETATQKRMIEELQESYEKRIAEIEKKSLQKLENDALLGSKETVEYDVFISHAWEDKDSFVDEFVEELKKQGVKVWYDTSQIMWGDSMRQRIDEGLVKSKFGIVILSPNYIADGKYWTRAELDGLFQLESINGKALLPIWHNLTKQQVISFSPIIANKKALTTATMTASEIAEELVSLIIGKIDNKEM